ncbi:MAG: ATP-binding protein [Gammaproteobacteria bacterium]
MFPRLARKTLITLAKGYPVVALTGPRQSGKTTLAKFAFPDMAYASLEDPDQHEFAEDDPRGFLARFPDGAILDEVQRCPALFSWLQGVVDADGRMGLFILTGSQQFGLLSGITQSLAGRVGRLQLLPFSLSEITTAGAVPGSLDELLFAGLYPPVYDRPVAPVHWYSDYVATYIERDVRQMINVQDLSTFQRFLRLCAGRHGQLLNLSALANDCGISHNTAKAWLSVLEASYIIHLLQPHHRNFRKRIVKTPKLYFLDTGLAAWLLGIQNANQLTTHSLRGALFEGWVIQELLKARFNQALVSNLFFWRDNTGNEIDVLLEKGERLQPIEIKSGQTLTRDYLTSLKKWIEMVKNDTVGIDTPCLLYGGTEAQQRSGIDVIPWREISGIAVKNAPA